MFKREIITLIFVIVAFSGCGQKKQKSMPNLKNKDLEESVASLTFIPDVPFGFSLHSIKHDAQNTQDSFKVMYHVKKSTKVEVADLKKSYRSEMELLGWDFISQFEDESELLLIFARPSNVLCQVRFDRDSVLTVLVLSNKKDRH